MNPILQVKRLCLDIEEFLDYTQPEDLIQATAEIVSWLKEHARTIDGREERLAALYILLGKSRAGIEKMNEEDTHVFHPPNLDDTWERRRGKLKDGSPADRPEQPEDRRLRML